MLKGITAMHWTLHDTHYFLVGYIKHSDLLLLSLLLFILSSLPWESLPWESLPWEG